MSEEGKYYVPQLEELFVGFEYEVPHTLNGGGWKLKTLDLCPGCPDGRLEYLECLIKAETIRVKYLDREDIESLGWVKYADGFRHGSLYGLQQLRNYRLRINIVHQTIFEGTIKNKSELRRLMKMLGI